MLISTKGRYAMRFMIDLALRGPEEKVSLREIAEFEGISLKYLEQLVRPLTQAGLGSPLTRTTTPWSNSGIDAPLTRDQSLLICAYHCSRMAFPQHHPTKAFHWQTVGVVVL